MEIENYVSEFRTLQQKGCDRVADFCRERSIDYFTMVEALKQDQPPKKITHEIPHVADFMTYSRL